jgi:hypothetical protein
MTWTSMQQCPVPLPLNNDAHDFSTSSNRRQEMDIRAFFAIGSGEVPGSNLNVLPHTSGSPVFSLLQIAKA